MRTLSTVFHNVGPFRDFALDFENIDGTLVALVAPNGSGKTTALEMAWLGTYYRDTETQGSLLDRATARDSFIESRVIAEDGETYTIRHNVDAVSRKSESVVTCSGKPAYKGTSVKTFDAWAAKNFRTRDVLCSTVFAVQGSAGFLGLPSAQRISVVLQAVGVAQVEKMAELSRKEEKTTKEQLKVLATRIADARLGARDVESVERELSECKHTESSAGWLVAEAQAELDVARQLAGDSALARQRYEEQFRAFNDLESRAKEAANARDCAVAQLEKIDIVALENAVVEATTDRDLAAKRLREAESLASELRTARDAANRQLEDRHRVKLELDRATIAKTDVEKRLANIRAILDKADEIRTAVTKTKELTELVARLEVDSVTAIAEVKRLSAEIAVHDADRRRHGEAAAEAERRIARANKTLAGGELVRAAAARLDDERKAVAACKAHVESAERELESLRGRRIAGAEERIASLRGGLTDIAGHLNVGYDEAQRIAVDTLEDDNAVVSASEELPGLIESADGDVALFRCGLHAAEKQLRDSEALAAKLTLVESAELELVEARSVFNAALSAANESERNAAAVSSERARVAAAGADAANVERHTRAQIATLADLVALADKLAAATGLRDERIAQLATATADVERLTEELEALPEPEPVSADPDVAGLRKAHERAADSVLLAERALAAAVATRAQLVPQLDKLHAEADALSAQLGATPAPVPPEAAPDITTLEAALRDAQTNQTTAVKRVGEVQQVLEHAKAVAARVAELEAERANLEAELSDWTRLCLDLGRDGIQSAEVDSAGPELTALTNDLLLSCHGSRYSARISTTRAKADNKGEVDECRVMVTDNNDGTEREAKQHSGGERVILGEAVSLALSMMACRRAGVKGVTLVRDESGAALDPVNARVYVSMLRHAAKVTGADKVLFVTHSREIQEMADAKITISESIVDKKEEAA